ncbi:MAG: hypothetical protein E6Q64_04870 [Ottowia sp.]|nr:MAG: hypothetical protein E6Q64_04870 [Ottowia sp.]
MGAAIAVVAPMLMGGGGLMGGLMGGMGGSGILSQILAGILGGAGGSGGAEGIGKAMQGFAPANVLNATANLVSSMLGNSTKDAARTLHREDGMPKFVMDAINKAVDEAVKKHFKPVDPETQNALNDVTKDDSMKEIKKLTDQLLEKVRELMNERILDETKEATSTDKKGEGAGKKKSAQSWFAAIAEAMGKVYGAKTAEVVRLSGEVSNVADKQAALAEKNKGIDPKDEKATKAAEAEKEKLAAEMTKKQTELQGAAQEMKLISETVSTLLKSIGEALAGMARKQ